MYLATSISKKLLEKTASLTKLEAQWAEPVSLTFHSVLRKFYTEPSIGVSDQISVYLVSEEKIFLEITRNKNRLCWPCFLTDQDKMSILYRGPSIDAFYHVLVHLAKQFQRRRFKKIDQSETIIASGGHVC